MWFQSDLLGKIRNSDIKIRIILSFYFFYIIQILCCNFKLIKHLVSKKMMLERRGCWETRTNTSLTVNRCIYWTKGWGLSCQNAAAASGLTEGSTGAEYIASSPRTSSKHIPVKQTLRAHRPLTHRRSAPHPGRRLESKHRDASRRWLAATD